MSSSDSDGSSDDGRYKRGRNVRSVIQAKRRSPITESQYTRRSTSGSPRSSDSDSDDGHNRRTKSRIEKVRNERPDRREEDDDDVKDDSGGSGGRGDYYKRRRYSEEKEEDEDERDRRKTSHERRERKEARQAENENEMNAANSEKGAEDSSNKLKRKAEIDPINTRAGGAYIPPAKLRMMQESIEDKSSAAYQRLSWEALKKSINGLINKVNVANIGNLVPELFQENIIRGRGPLAQSIIRAQAASPIFTNVYAALVSVVNTKFPKIGELILRRLILQFRKSFRRNDKPVCISSAQFIAHLINQQVAHEILGLELLTLLLQNPTDDSVEVAIGFLKEVSMKLTEVSPRGVNAVFERLRNILHDGQIDKRVQYMIEVMFAIRKDGFKDHPAIVEGLDLVEESDQITHLLRMECEGTSEDILNVFKLDPNFLENEEKYKEIKRDILGEDADSDASSDDDDDDDEDEEDEEKNEEANMDIIDQTESNLVALRRTIYLTIQSSLDFEECAHKMLKMDIKPAQMGEVCSMIIDCCAQQRSYEKFFGLLGQRFCQLKKEFMEEFVRLFKDQYDTIHRLETNKLRNVAKFFAHLLFTDAIPWTVLSCINLNEDDTTSSSRIFIKILFQELAEYMGLSKLDERIRDPFIGEYCEGIFPRDNPRNTRFSINFFTSIGLGGLTEDLREHLKNAPKIIMAQKHTEKSDSEDSSDESESSDDSSSDSTDSEEERRRRKKRSQMSSKRKSSKKSKKKSSRR